MLLCSPSDGVFISALIRYLMFDAIEIGTQLKPVFKLSLASEQNDCLISVGENNPSVKNKCVTHEVRRSVIIITSRNYTYLYIIHTVYTPLFVRRSNYMYKYF